jgi:hypothetical protein
MNHKKIDGRKQHADEVGKCESAISRVKHIAWSLVDEYPILEVRRAHPLLKSAGVHLLIGVLTHRGECWIPAFVTSSRRGYKEHQKRDSHPLLSKYKVRGFFSRIRVNERMSDGWIREQVSQYVSHVISNGITFDMMFSELCLDMQGEPDKRLQCNDVPRRKSGRDLPKIFRPHTLHRYLGVLPGYDN